MSKSVMLRTSNEDIKLNIDNYPVIDPNGSLANLPNGWCYVPTVNHELRKKFPDDCGCGSCFTNTYGTAFQIYICDDRNKTYMRYCGSGDTNLNNANWFLKN